MLDYLDWLGSRWDNYGMLLSTIGFVLSMWEGQKISRKASEIIEKSTDTSAKQCISKEKFKQSLKVHTKCAKSVNKLRYVKILHLGGSPPTIPQ